MRESRSENRSKAPSSLFFTKIDPILERPYMLRTCLFQKPDVGNAFGMIWPVSQPFEMIPVFPRCSFFKNVLTKADALQVHALCGHFVNPFLLFLKIPYKEYSMSREPHL